MKGPADHNRPEPLRNKYVIFFDVNISKGVRDRLESLEKKAKLIFLNNERSIFNKHQPLNEMEDPDLFNYVLRYIDFYCPSAICFFFTVDGKILREISIRHPARQRLYIECFKQRSKEKFHLLTSEIIDRFENIIKKLE